MTTKLDAEPTAAEQPSTAPVKVSRPALHPREALTAYLFLSPAMISFVLFLAIPMLMTFLLSFVNWNGITLGGIRIAGLSNYAKLFHDSVFWEALRNNMIFLGLGMTFILAVGLFVAVLLEQSLPGTKFFRGIFFMPTVLSPVVIGIIFGFLLDPTFGILKPILGVFGVHMDPAPLANPGHALYVLIGIETWRSFGFAMFLFVAGLKALDQALVEAARIDGATAWQTFWHVTLPQLRPVTLMVATLVGINELKLFDIVYVMTQGGPSHATEVLNTYAETEGFDFNMVGYGSTIAVVMLFITFMLTIVRFKALPDERREAKRKS